MRTAAGDTWCLLTAKITLVHFGFALILLQSGTTLDYRRFILIRRWHLSDLMHEIELCARTGTIITTKKTWEKLTKNTHIYVQKLKLFTYIKYSLGCYFWFWCGRHLACCKKCTERTETTSSQRRPSGEKVFLPLLYSRSRGIMVYEKERLL